MKYKFLTLVLALSFTSLSAQDSNFLGLEAFDDQGNPTTVKLDPEVFEVLPLIQVSFDKANLMIDSLGGIINDQRQLISQHEELIQRLIEQVKLNVQDIDELKKNTTIINSDSESEHISEFEIMLSVLRTESLSKFNAEYTEKRIVEIALNVPELPGWLKDKTGKRDDKVQYLIDNFIK